MIWYLLILHTLSFQSELTIDEVTQIDVTLVDVLVLDAKGNPIRDLQQQDFRVYENQKQVSLNYFEVMDFRDPARLEPSQNDPEMQTLILILDLARMDLPATRTTLQAVRFFLEQQPSLFPAQTMLYSFDTGRITAGFLRDKAAILDDFTQFEINFLNRREALPALHEPFHLATLERELHQCVPKMQRAPSAWQSSSAGTMGRNCLLVAYDQFRNRHQQQSEAILSGFTQVLSSLSGIEGLKSVYLVSPGFSLAPCETASHLASRYLQTVSTSQRTGLFSSGSLAPGVQTEGSTSASLDLNQILNSRAPVANVFTTHNFERELLELAHHAFLNRTVIHTFSVTQNLLSERQNHAFANAEATYSALAGTYQNFAAELDYGLQALSSATGGLHCRNKHIGQHLQETFQSSSVYYVLGYSPPLRKGKKHHRLRVECTRPDTVVYTQSGFFRLAP